MKACGENRRGSSIWLLDLGQGGEAPWNLCHCASERLGVDLGQCGRARLSWIYQFDDVGGGHRRHPATRRLIDGHRRIRSHPATRMRAARRGAWVAERFMPAASAFDAFVAFLVAAQRRPAAGWRMFQEWCGMRLTASPAARRTCSDAACVRSGCSAQARRSAQLGEDQRIKCHCAYTRQ